MHELLREDLGKLKKKGRLIQRKISRYIIFIIEILYIKYLKIQFYILIFNKSLTFVLKEYNY